MTLKEAVFRMVAEKRVTAEQALDLLRRLPAAPPPPDGIAVVGMAASYADAADLDAVWAALDAGRECFRAAPNDRWPDAPPVAVRGGFLPDADRFDPAFFRLSVTEAAMTDPQQRVFLEQAFHALEHAGYAAAELAGARCGVFVGSGAGDYAQRLSRAGVGPEPTALIGNVPSILAARLAYFLNLKGPAVAVDTACSSSLVAVHLACESLRSGACDLAVAGGVTVVSTPNLFAALTKAGMISPTGRCRAFGAGADGFVCGEGAGAVVLKPLATAVADGDTIYGVIRASGFNQDGRTNGITAPSAPAQTDLLADVWRRAGVDPATISYVEAHGTGTELGDPIEVEALSAAFRQFTPARGFCRLGSAKPNFGHALAAAGVLGLVKVLLALHHRRLPPTLHADPPSPHVDFANAAVRLQTAGEPWEPTPGKPRRAAVSSFGFSGTNAHLLVEDPPPGAAVPRRSPKPRTLFKRVDCSPNVLAPRTDPVDDPDRLRKGIVPSMGPRPPSLTHPHQGEGDRNLADRATGFAALEVHGRDRLAAAFAEMGLFADRRAFTVAGLRRRLGVIDKYRGLFHALLGELEAHGTLTRDGEIVRVGPPMPPAGDRAGLLARFPDFAPLVEFLEACVGSYPRTLTGRAAATEVLFPGGSMRLVEGVYRQNALADFFNRRCADVVRAAVEAASGAGPVRVLEVGAGTGSATARVLPALAALGRPVEYLFTDVSVGFLQHGKQQFGRDFPFVRFQAFDLNRDPDGQGLPPGGFDVALASNVVHATDDIGRSLARLWRLVKPGGAVVLNEVTAVQTFATLTFGLTDGWWAFRDGPARLPNAPLLDVPRWTAALAAAGFPTAEATGLPGETDPARFAQAVIVAHRDARPVPESRAVPAAAPPPAVAVTTGCHGGVEDAVAAEVAAALTTTPAAIDPQARFLDFGVDSVLGVDVVTRLNARFGLDLRPSVLFDFPTVADLAGHLEADHGVRPDAPVGRVESSRPDTPTSEDAGPRRLDPTDNTDPAAGPVPVAVIGMACRFPGARTPDEFFALLAAGKSAVTAVPADRWSADPADLPDDLKPHADCVKWGGFLDGIDRFDPLFFAMSGADAEQSDPQHRLFLMECWKALEDAGYPAEAVAGTRCGVFVGAHGGDYTHKMMECGVDLKAAGFMGNSAAILASRIAYTLNLKGPALPVDTACSSSLVALHLACRSLAAGECDTALVGGVFVTTTRSFHTAATRAGMLSPTGGCKPFDAAADGFTPGEGVGVVFLKPLAKAVADGDRIAGVVLASAINQDGKTNGITAPSPQSQAALVREVHAAAGADPDRIGYVEAHGTGTRLGDPIEIEGLTRAFRTKTDRVRFCPVGSVKANVGHTAHAAGVAGFLKVLLGLREKVLFPAVNFTRPNPALRLSETPFAVNTALREWPAPPGGGPRLASVSSFGFSGTNAHVLLGEAPPAPPRAGGAAPAYLFPLSAKTPDALARKVADLRAWLRDRSPPVADVAHTLLAGRSHFPVRWAVVAADLAELRRALEGGPVGAVESEPGAAAGLRSAVAAAAELPAFRQRLEALADLYRRGASLAGLDLAPGGRRIALPTYPFAEERYWLVPEPANPPAAAVRFFEPAWEPNAAPATGPGSGPLLVVGPDAAFAHAVAAALGGAEVHTGSSDTRPTLAALAAAGRPVRAVVLLGGLEPPTGDPDVDARSALEPLLTACQGLSRGGPARVLAFHRPDPVAATAGAFRKSLEPVAPHVRVHTVELSTRPAASDLAGLIEVELAADPAEVRYDAAGRFRRVMRPLARPAAPPPPVRPGDAVLITGGAGGLGRLFARHLAGLGANVALVGRSAWDAAAGPPEALGGPGAVEYWQADVTDGAALDRAVADVTRRFGPLRGVVHAAGRPGGEPVTAKTWDRFRESLRTKLDGALALDRATRGQPLDWFVLFSSLSSVHGDFGQCDYAAANRFLDEFAAVRTAAGGPGATVAIGWPMWADGTRHLSADAAALYERVSGLGFLPAGAGLAAFADAVALGKPRVTVVVGTADVFAEKPALVGRVVSSRPDVARVSGLEDSTRPTRNAPEIEAVLTGMIAELLKLDPARVRRQTSFSDFGFDSISLKEFAARLSARFAADVTPAVFFAHSSVASLAGYLAAAAPGNPAAVPISHAAETAVAIVGAAGVFPQSEDLDAFWRHLDAGRDLISEVPADRWDWRAYAGDGATQSVSKWGGFVPDPAAFDAEFFGVSAREARFTDPQHRLFLQTSWAALEDAGLRPSALAGRRVGVFAGQQISEYGHAVTAEGTNLAHLALGTAPALLANRVSFLLDFRGPSEAVDTACSSALVVVHRAARSVLSGECELAIAGAVSLMLSPQTFVSTSRLGVLSPDGRCRTFDARANGYVKGEGVGVVVLKPLARALADGDPIRGVLIGTGENHGGRANSMTAPNPTAQAELIAGVIGRAGVDPETITYVEAHGTGTELGDPVEVDGLVEAFRRAAAGRPLARTGFCGLGAVKTNVGHLEPASGMAGLMKVLLALKHGRLPATLHQQSPNPYLRLAGSPFTVIDRNTPWEPGRDAAGRPAPRRAGVSSFGFGGANAHVLVEEPPVPHGPVPASASEWIVLSARNPDRLRAYAGKLAGFLRGAGATVPFASVAYTLQTGREAMAFRFALGARDHADAAEELERFAAGETTGPWRFGEVPTGIDGERLRRDALPADELARRWVAGADVDWTRPAAPPRVHLPTYPFAPTRHWADAAPKQPSDSLDAFDADPAGPRFRRLFRAADPLVADHRIRGQLVVPGAVYLELLLAAARRWRPESRAVGFRGVLFLHPFVVGDAGRTAVGRFLPGGGPAVTYEFASEGPGGPPVVHSRGAVVFDDSPVSPPSVDVDAVRGRCPDHRGRDEIYARVRAEGMDFGPTFQGLRQVWTGTGEALAELAPPPGDDVGKHLLHPTVLDGAIQATVGLVAMSYGRKRRPMLPFSVEELTVFAPLTPVSYSYVRQTAGSEGSAKFDVTILDPAGRPLVSLRDVYLRAVARPESAAPLSPPSLLGKGAGGLGEALPGSEVPPNPLTPFPTREGGIGRDAVEVVTHLQSVFAAVLETTPDRLDPRATYDRFGIDSFLAVEILQRLETEYGPLPKELLFEHLTIEKLATHLAAKPVPDLWHRPLAGEGTHRPEAGATRNELDPQTGTGDIAIVGLSGRYPGAADLREFWANLRAGTSGIREVPADRWDHAPHHAPNPTPGKAYTKWGGFIDHADRFDPLFFGISPAEAEAMDPHERVFVEESWKALEDAGYPPARLAAAVGTPDGNPVGVFAGVMYGPYQWYGIEQWVRGGPGTAHSAYWSIANRVSYLFDFHGPSLAVDTACSSSLAAIHLACEALRRGECKVALAGGVNLILHPRQLIALSHLRMLSRGPTVKAYGAGADGFVDGEGVGVAVLRPLADALAAGDRVLAVIKGSAVNAGGKTSGYTVPNPNAQAGVIAAAFARAGVEPASIGYVEGHGTGTPLGDPIEVRALTRAFGSTVARQSVPLGSVKPNVGHLESAAGVAGLTKAVLQLVNREIAPTLNADPPSPDIRFADTPFRLPTRVEPWPTPAGGGPRRAAVSSFGAGGANAHLILEEAPPAPRPVPPAGPAVFVLSARNDDRLREAADRLAAFVAGGTDPMADVAHTLRVGREPMAARLAVVAGGRQELVGKLRAFLAGRPMPGVFHGAAGAGDDPLSLLAAKWAAGGTADWPADGGRVVSVPTYPFLRKRFWAPDAMAAANGEPTANGDKPPARNGTGSLLTLLDGFEG